MKKKYDSSEKAESFIRFTKMAGIYLMLIVMVVIALLPLGWMIIVALKEPGQALRVDFIPQTTIKTEKKIMEVSDKKQPAMTVFLYRGSGERVSVAGSFNGWDKNAAPLKKKEPGVWEIALKLSPGSYVYKFVIDDKTWLADPLNPLKDSGGNGNSMIKVSQSGAWNVPPADQSSVNASGNALFVFRPPQADIQSVSLVLKGKTPQKMKKKKDGLWETNAVLTQGAHPYHFEIQRGFLSAAKAMYTIGNFKKILYNPDFPFGQFFKNSLIVAFLAAFFTSILCTMAGYAFAKKQFPGRDMLFTLLMFSMMIPGMIYMVPQFAIVTKMNWMNSYQGMVVPHLANIFGVFLLRQYIQTIPNSLFEAAQIDGANDFQVFRIIILPLCLPIIVTLFLLTFVGQWSNFLWQLIVNTPDSPLRTLPVGLALFRGQYAIRWELMMSAACFTILPIAAIFIVAQKTFIEGMTQGAVKE